MTSTTKPLGLAMRALLFVLALASPALAVLQGDCNNDGTVAINEVVRCSNIYLETQALALCPPCDRLGDGLVTIDDVVGSSNCYLDSGAANCRMSTPGAGPTNTQAATPTPTNTLVQPTATNTNTPVTPAAPTATSTNTPVPPTATNTAALATPTSTIGSTTPLIIPIEVVGGSGLATSCTNKKCVAGPLMGMACNAASDCRRCVGGSNAGNPCTGPPAQCPGGTCPQQQCGNGTCVGGATAGRACTSGTDCNGCALSPTQGSCAIVQNPLFAVRVPLNGVCAPRVAPDIACTLDSECPQGKTCQASGLTMEVTPNGDGTYDVKVPKESLFLPPAIISGIGIVCVVAGGDGVGTIDCNGGTPGIDFTLSVDHNTTPADICLDGPNKGMACSTDANCPTTASCLENKCSAGSRMGMACNSPAECPATAVCNKGNGGSSMGLPDDPTCSSTFVTPAGTTDYACLEGTRQCSGGTNAGGICDDDGDCPGSTCGGPCNTSSFHPNICNSPTVATIEGTYGPGDMVITQPLAISILSADLLGPDMLACTPDDTPPSPPAGVPVALSTGTNTINVFDAANDAGGRIGPSSNTACTMGGGQCPAGELCRNAANTMLACAADQTCQCKQMCGSFPCAAQIIGAPVLCSALQSGDLSGVTLGGGFPALDTTAGDIATTFTFVVE